MIDIDVTMVRSKETKEPVAIFEQTSDLVSLGAMIDEIVDPALCEYSDQTISIDLGLIFSNPTPEFIENQERQSEAISLGGFSSGMCYQILEYFLCNIIEWVEFPENFDSLSSDLDFEDRFWGSKFKESNEKDVF